MLLVIDYMKLVLFVSRLLSVVLHIGYLAVFEFREKNIELYIVLCFIC